MADILSSVVAPVKDWRVVAYSFPVEGAEEENSDVIEACVKATCRDTATRAYLKGEITAFHVVGEADFCYFDVSREEYIQCVEPWDC